MGTTSTGTNPRHATRRRPITMLIIVGLIAALLVPMAAASPVAAASGDFAIDFTAAAPNTYDHTAGGGAYNDRTVGVDDDIVESLEGGDFSCFDIVTYLVQVVVDDTQSADDDAPQTIEMDFAFLADTTGQSGVAIGEFVSVGVNYGAVVNGAGPGGTDAGIQDDGGSTATLINDGLTGPLFTAGSELQGTVVLDDLERAEEVIVRIDVRLFCDPGSNPTGNLQARLDDARLTATNGNVPVVPPEAVSGGAQTIPFKQIGNIERVDIFVDKVTDPPGALDLFDFQLSETDIGLIADFSLADADPEFGFTGFPGSYSVAELTPPAGWVLTASTCSINGGGPVDPASLVLVDGDVANCTFTNTQAGNIIVAKETDPDGSAQLFDFSSDYGADFQLADGQTNNSGPLLPTSEAGTYSVSETVPAGWELSSATCDDGSDPAAIDLAAGETVTCTFTNEQDAHIIVEKQTDPDGSTELFDFTTNYSDPFQLADGQSNNSGDLDPGTYSVTETVPADWELSSATCDDGSVPTNIDLAAGETVTCTFNNFLQRGNIVVVKQTDPDGSSQLFDFTSSYGADFELADGQTNDSGPILPGTYSVAETVPAGWTLTSATCDDGSPVDAIQLSSNETVTCTFTNNIDRGTIIVEKQTDPDGSTQPFDFTTNYSDPFQLADDETNTTGGLLPTSEAGTYSVTETVPADWSLTSATCDDGSPVDAIDLAPGETVTCTFTNTINRGNIVVIKQTDPDGSTAEFDFTPSYGPDFTLTDGGSNDSGPLLPTSEAGTYSVSETVPAGWELSSATCDDGSPVDAIDLAAGETVTCTFTNQQDAHIIVVKQTDPDGSSAEFNFDASYDPDGFILSDGQSNDSGDLDPGTYSVTEVGLPDGWTLSSATCDDGSVPTNIELAAGETVTCTFNNTLARGTIIVEKQTDPDGSTQPFDFTTNYSDPFQLADDETNTTGGLLPTSEAGPYSVAETNIPAGWNLTDATCDDGSNPSAISLDPGETVTCTFTNTIDRGTIIVEKQTDPDGSTQPFDFTTNYSDPFQLADDETNTTGGLLPTSEAGTYSVTETVPADWSLTSATCDDGSPVDAIDLAPGETVTCTFTNTLARGNIVIVKQTLPDGNNTTFDFEASYDNDGFTLGDGESDNSGPLLPGVYTVNELVPDGWQLTDLTCTDPSGGTTTSGSEASIDLAAGETVTCTYTNTKLGEIRIQKVTLPNDSTQTFDFEASYDFDGFTLGHLETNNSGPLLPGSYTVTELVPDGWDLTRAECDDGFPPTDPSVEPIDLEAGEIINCVFENTQRGTIAVAKETLPDGDPATFDFTGDVTATLGDGETSTPVEVIPGQYTATETVPAGWNLTNITCDDGDSTGTDTTATFNVQPGEDVICTFTNTQLGSITVVKQTDPAGSAQLFEFTSDYGDPFQLADGQSDNSGPLLPGTYAVSETVPPGWELSSATCSDGSTVDAIDLAAGENVTCTFTNQQDANIVIVKQTLPDGNNTTFDFEASYDADGFTLGDGQSNDSGDLDPGVYTVTELVPDGWQLTDLTCVDPSGGTTTAGPEASIDLSAGETVTCTYTNTKLGEIRIQKVTLPNDSTQTFDFEASYDFDGFTLGHLETNNSGPLLPGSYTVTELVPDGWDLTRAECDDGFPPTDPSVEPIDLEAGEIINCVFENTQRGTIAVAKQTLPDGDPTTFDFTGDVTATLSDDETSTPVEVIPGQYSSTETVPAGWDLTDISCDDNDSTGTDTTATFNVQPGEDVICTFTNTKRGMVELLKLTNGDPNATTAWSFTLTGPEVDQTATTPPTTIDFGGAKLIPGEEYTLCETGIPAAWTTEWMIDTDGDGVPDTVIEHVGGVNNDPVDPLTGYSRVYDPNYVPWPGEYSNDTRCVNFVVEPGQTLAFQIDNQAEGGEPRTIGFWKNWSTCTNGNQPQTAANNGGPDEGWYILDDLLADPGFNIGLVELGADDCEAAVKILDKRDQDGKKRASDAAYRLASQLLAAELNLAADAQSCFPVNFLVAAGQAILTNIGFDGTGPYLRPQDGQLYRDANLVAALLDAYNNGTICGP